MKKIWLVRHAESRAQTGEDGSILDPALSATGEQQAERLGKRLGDEAYFDRIVVSPMLRTRQTYLLSGIQAPIVQLDSRIIEHHEDPETYSEILPYPAPEIDAKPDPHNAWLRPSVDRIAELIEEDLVLDKDKDENIVVFGHFGSLNLFFKLFTRMQETDTRFDAMHDNTGITRVEEDDDQDRKVRYQNDRRHVVDLITNIR